MSWWAERRRLSSFTHPSQAPQHLLLFVKRGKTKGLRNVWVKRSVDLTPSKVWSLFLCGTLTDADCPPAHSYVRLEMEQTQQALLRLHLWYASSGEIPSLLVSLSLYLASFFCDVGIVDVENWCWCCFVVKVRVKHLFFSVFVLHLLLAAVDRQQETVSHRSVAELPHNHWRAP